MISRHGIQTLAPPPKTVVQRERVGQRGNQSLGAFVRKEIRHILRDRQTLTILLLLPLVQVVLFGFALRTDIHKVRLVIVDPTPDYASRALRSRFAGSARFQVSETSPSMASLAQVFERDAADVAVVIDPAFGEHLAAGAPARLLLIVDASDPNTGSIMEGYATAVIADFQAELTAASPGVRIVPVTRMRFNPTLESVNLFVPGLIALVLTIVSALMSAISLSREKERGTLEILLVSPLRPPQIIIGKVLPYLGLALANMITALAAAWLVFDVPFRGSLALLLSEGVLYSLVSLALGVLIAARTNSQRAAMLGAVLGTMMPSVLLSGLIFPIASMPAWLQPLTYAVPARWFIAIARGVMLQGLGLAHLWQETFALCAMAIVVLVAAMRSFHARLN